MGARTEATPTPTPPTIRAAINMENVFGIVVYRAERKNVARPR